MAASLGSSRPPASRPPESSRPPSRPPALAPILGVTFLGSVSSGAFGGGLYFVTAGAYGFSPARNLALGTAMGALSVLGAWSSGRLARRGRPRTLVTGALGVWACAALLPVLAPESEGVLWLAALVGGAASAMMWPILESYVSAGRHGAPMRNAIGLFNLSWTTAVALPLFALPALARFGGAATLGLAGLTNGLAMILALALPARPGHHQAEHADAATGAEYPWLARASSWLLPVSYVLSTMLSPLLPFRLAALGLGEAASAVAALWMAARFATFLVMWRSGFWHGRWGTLAAGGAALALGMGLVLLGPSLTLVVPGLLVFGLGMGLVYYCALYYSLTVGRAEVDAGGRFESLVGLGSSLGPLLGMAGQALGRARPPAPSLASSPSLVSAGLPASLPASLLFSALLGVLVLLLALPGALRPYRRARRGRR